MIARKDVVRTIDTQSVTILKPSVKDATISCITGEIQAAVTQNNEIVSVNQYSSPTYIENAPRLNIAIVDGPDGKMLDKVVVIINDIPSTECTITVFSLTGYIKSILFKYNEVLDD